MIGSAARPNMNSEKVELIYRRTDFGLRHPSGYDYPRMTSHIDLVANYLAINWGCATAVRLAEKGCYKWALAFWIWAVDCYHPWPPKSAPVVTDNRNIELRLVRAAWFMSTWGCDLAWQVPQDWSFSLSDTDWKLIFDAVGRGIDPEKALRPKRHRNPKYIALMAAAQTIAKHETAKS